MPRLRFGIKTAPQHTTYAARLDVWRIGAIVRYHANWR